MYLGCWYLDSCLLSRLDHKFCGRYFNYCPGHQVCSVRRKQGMLFSCLRQWILRNIEALNGGRAQQKGPGGGNTRKNPKAESTDKKNLLAQAGQEKTPEREEPTTLEEAFSKALT